MNKIRLTLDDMTDDGCGTKPFDPEDMEFAKSVVTDYLKKLNRGEKYEDNINNYNIQMR